MKEKTRINSRFWDEDEGFYRMISGVIDFIVKSADKRGRDRDETLVNVAVVLALISETTTLKHYKTDEEEH